MLGISTSTTAMPYMLTIMYYCFCCWCTFVVPYHVNLELLKPDTFSYDSHEPFNLWPIFATIRKLPFSLPFFSFTRITNILIQTNSEQNFTDVLGYISKKEEEKISLFVVCGIKWNFDFSSFGFNCQFFFSKKIDNFHIYLL